MSILANTWVISIGTVGVNVEWRWVMEVQATEVINMKINWGTTKEDLPGIPHPPA